MADLRVWGSVKRLAAAFEFARLVARVGLQLDPLPEQVDTRGLTHGGIIMDHDEISRESAHRVLERFYRAVASQDIALLRTIVTDDWQYIPGSCGPHSARGPEAMVGAFTEFSSSLSDIDIRIVDVLIHGNRVGVRARITGKQSGSLMGISATSKPVEFAIHSFHEIEGGRIAKTWHLEDWLGAFRQVGGLSQTFDDPERTLSR
jgi:predicted ester cyclase